MGNLVTLAFIASLVNVGIAGEGDGFVSNDRYRGTYFGMLCSNVDVAGSELKGGNQLPISVAEAVALSESIVYEGGYDYLAAGKQKRSYEHEGKTISEALRLQHYRRSSVLAGFLSCVPIAMAYVKRSDQGLRAGALAVARGKPGNSEWRGSGRAFVAILSGCLHRSKELTRPMIINRVAAMLDSRQVSAAVLGARKARASSRSSRRPHDVLCDVLRCWYHSKSYEDALSRLDPEAGPLRRAMVGALAGAEYGASRIPRFRWIVLRERVRYEGVFVRLDDLAREGALISVPDDAPQPEESVGNNNSAPMIANVPEIPAVPAVPVVRVPVFRAGFVEPPEFGGSDEVSAESGGVRTEYAPRQTLQASTMVKEAKDTEPAVRTSGTAYINALLKSRKAKVPASASEVKIFSASLPEEGSSD